MPAPTSTAELIDLVRKSGLYEGDSFDNRLGDLPRLPEQPTSTATLLVKHGLITKFQAKLLLLGKYRGFRDPRRPTFAIRWHWSDSEKPSTG